MKFTFYEAWDFLTDHQYYNWDGPNSTKSYNEFMDSLCIEIVKVNPKTKSINKNKNLNTETRVWLESGCKVPIPEFDNELHWSHDTDLDCGGQTFEEAVIKLAGLVFKNYGGL